MPPKTIIISSGYPAGIGPYVSVLALKNLKLQPQTRIILVGDESVLGRIRGFSRLKKKIIIENLKNARRIKCGRLSRQSGRAALQYLERAVELVRQYRGAALVTAPVSKEAISLNTKFSGHTEFLAKAFSCPEVLMMMVGRRLKVALLSRHIPLRQVSRFILRNDFRKSLELVLFALKRLFKVSFPKVGVCSFNPHAGVGTFLAKEEKALAQSLKPFRKQAEFIGPLPADTVFRLSCQKKWDCVLALYHDQAMIPFRLLEFEHGVNLTVGLPFVRTSPAHGVGIDLVKMPHLVNPSSMQAAIELAISLSQPKN